MKIAHTLEQAFAEQGGFDEAQWSAFLEALERGDIRVVEQQTDGEWQ